MLDSDLAALYQVETKRLNEAVKRNMERFPLEFRFQLTEEEFHLLRSQFATSKERTEEGGENRGGRTYLPYAFTEQGIAMLSAVLKSKTAIQVSINIMNTFVVMRKFMGTQNFYTAKYTKLTAMDIAAFNNQYPKLEVKITSAFHDRFLILDREKVYHVGASLKDAGKKCFAVSLLDDDKILKAILHRLKDESDTAL